MDAPMGRQRGGGKLDTPAPRGAPPAVFYAQDLRPGRNLTSCRGILRLAVNQANHDSRKDVGNERRQHIP